MKLSNAHLAIVAREKVTEYLLSRTHRYGAAKSGSLLASASARRPGSSRVGAADGTSALIVNLEAPIILVRSGFGQPSVNGRPAPRAR
jgi:hypothetical protein